MDSTEREGHVRFLDFIVRGGLLNFEYFVEISHGCRWGERKRICADDVLSDRREVLVDLSVFSSRYLSRTYLVFLSTQTNPRTSYALAQRASLVLRVDGDEERAKGKENESIVISDDIQRATLSSAHVRWAYLQLFGDDLKRNLHVTMNERYCDEKERSKTKSQLNVILD